MILPWKESPVTGRYNGMLNGHFYEVWRWASDHPKPWMGRVWPAPSHSHGCRYKTKEAAMRAVENILIKLELER